MPDRRFVVVTHDGVGDTVKGGERATTYELAEPWPYDDLRPHGGRHIELDRYRLAVLTYGNADENWRVQEVLRCDCKAGGQVAQLLAHKPSRRLWAVVGGDRPPKRLGEVPHNEKGTAMPLHGQPGEQPCSLGASTCRQCKKSWWVVVFHDRVELLELARSTHGARVVT